MFRIENREAGTGCALWNGLRPMVRFAAGKRELIPQPLKSNLSYPVIQLSSYPVIQLSSYPVIQLSSYPALFFKN
ncbi:hypothetical protein [Vibrio tubiashii]|uniref:hypothetical protein n=1 Tax=Vibrio tubiashii TaxID=29498 RepID=UPI00349ED7AB